ncbi:hypothetical protein OZX68_03760 [Streptococcaceae bacterium ESL0729]|nr:hypothetical protein OZX68_03760 [Streptococcaceae bacterium ESL0729]
MKLWTFLGGRVKLTLTDGFEFTGTVVDYIDEEDVGDEDMVTIYIDYPYSKKFTELTIGESEINSIEVIK